MDVRNIEVKRILSQNVPTIRIRLRPSLRLRRVVDHSLRVLGAGVRAIRGLFPKRVYLILE
jgi:hypothetical protein